MDFSKLPFTDEMMKAAAAKDTVTQQLIEEGVLDTIIEAARSQTSGQFGRERSDDHGAALLMISAAFELLMRKAIDAKSSAMVGLLLDGTVGTLAAKTAVHGAGKRHLSELKALLDQ